MGVAAAGRRWPALGNYSEYVPTTPNVDSHPDTSVAPGSRALVAARNAAGDDLAVGRSRSHRLAYEGESPRLLRACDIHIDAVAARWTPKRIERINAYPLATSTAPVLVTTDDGTAYAKLMGNPQGNGALACDFIGTKLAARIGLNAFDAAIVPYPPELCDITFPGGGSPVPGPALVMRAELGHMWGGEESEFELLDNLDGLAGLVVLDTWLRNPDRYLERDGIVQRCNQRNVYFTYTTKKGQLALCAMDFDQAIRGRTELHSSHLAEHLVADPTIYGLFPAFIGHLERKFVSKYAAAMKAVKKAEIQDIVAALPAPWLDEPSIRDLLTRFICDRSAFVGGNIENWLEDPCMWDPVLPLQEDPR